MTHDKTQAALDWTGLDKILRGMRARNEQGSLALTNWIADNRASLIYTAQAELEARNRELLEALKETRDVIRVTGVLNNMKYDALGAKVLQAITRAEKGGV